MFDMNEKEFKKEDLMFDVEKLSGTRKALIALLGLSVVIGGVNGYNQNSEKISENPVFIQKSNKMSQINEQTR